MKTKLLILVMLVIPFAGKAQFGGLLNRVKKTAAEAVGRKADQATEDAVNGALEKKPKIEKQTQTVPPENQTSQDQFKAYSRFDFVPGEKVIYADDFSQDAVGEFPLQWTTKGHGEVMTLSGQQGKWLRGFKNTTITSVNPNELGDNYTVEFDMIYYFGAKEAVYVMPDIAIRLLNNYTVNFKNASGNVSERAGEQSYQFVIHPKDESSLAWVESHGTTPEFSSEKATINSFSKMYNQPVHYAIQVQKSRLRIWMNEKKVFDLPQAINSTKKPARIAFEFGHTSYNDEEVGYYVSNIRMAAGNADTRHKLLETGSFSTSGILFDVNSNVIKPQSFGILNEMAKVLTDNPAVRVKITGHTSADGNAYANLDLSKSRAQAVKDFLVKANIDAARIETTGLGDTKPVAPNTTQAGRVQNRRVEFTKL